MIKRVKKYKKELFFLLLIIFQLAIIVLYNLTQIRNQADFDSSVGMMQVVEIWRQKTFLIQDWGYQTTVGWDIPLSLAVFIYGLTKNVFLSLGIANIVFIALFIFVIFDILRICKVKRLGRLFTFCIFLTPYTMGQLGYVPMLFTGTASYAMKLLIPLLLMDIFVRIKAEKKVKSYLCQILLCFLFSILSSLSSGVFILICGVCPFLLYLCLDTLLKNDLKRLKCKETLVVGIIVLAFGIGAVLGNWWQLGNKSTTMNILAADKVADNALNCFVGFLELFGGYPTIIPVSLMSAQGIVHCFSLCVVIMVIIAVVYYAVGILKKKEHSLLVYICECIIFVNACVFLIADTRYSSVTFEYRYHIISAVCAMMLTGKFVAEMGRILNCLSKKMILVVLYCFICVISIHNFKQYFDTAKENPTHELSQITDCAKENDIDLIIDIVGDPDDDNELYHGRLLRLCDFDIDVATLRAYNEGVTWGASEKFFENANHRGKTMVMTIPEYYEAIPEFIKNKMVYCKTLMGYDLYIMQKNVFDCSVKLPSKGKTSIDFPYSTGYALWGEIDSSGFLVPKESGGTVICGPNMPVKEGTYSITLKYHQPKRQKNRIGQIVGEIRVVSKKGEILDKVDLISDKRKVMIENLTLKEEKEEVHYEVVTVENSDILIKSIITRNNN